MPTVVPCKIFWEIIFGLRLWITFVLRLNQHMGRGKQSMLKRGFGTIKEILKDHFDMGNSLYIFKAEIF